VRHAASAGQHEPGRAESAFPKATYNPTTAPTGLTFCRGCGLAGSEGALFFAEWNTGRVRRVYLGASPRTSVAAQGVVYTHSDRILAVERSPDGAIHISDAGGIYRLVSG
jgi:glucose/arabinose dehydrogenase